MEVVYLIIVIAPLVAAATAGLLGKQIGRAGAHTVTIIGVTISFALSIYSLKVIALDGGPIFNESVYHWGSVGGLTMEIGFLVDHLTVLMMTVVTFVSLAVHIYTVGYMHDDDGYQRFFSYISLFTFAMLMLVMSNNFLQLFFGWEAVGVVSYLLIGFWFKKDTAIFANMKAFLVNRVGDFGFLLGIAILLMFAGSLDYYEVFSKAELISDETLQVFSGNNWSVLTIACICLFVGAMGKSAQVPLHVWLPDSMEGPTPISALIHAATMVTAGIFMVARMSPLFEYSQTALSFVLVIGATTAFFTGLLGVIQNDIKRVVAYSTLSQLGYMTVALGASAYAAGIFHLMTHAFFKALLFLAAGSVIIALHHEQDIRKMGGLRKYMPITYWTSLIGTLALIGFPGFSGFFSKDALIEAVHLSEIGGANYAYWCVMLGVFITALYSFRVFFLVFHGKERITPAAKKHLRESPAVVTFPLVLLAIPSIFIGWFTIEPILFSDFFGNAIFVMQGRDVIEKLGADFHGSLAFISHAATASFAIYLSAAGALLAWFLYLKKPDYPEKIQQRFNLFYQILDKKYYFDLFNERVIARGMRLTANSFWKIGDQLLIDGLLVNGSAQVVRYFSVVSRSIQSGYLYHYAFAMVIGLAIILGFLILG